ncbi:putative transcription factor/ chromatin remodeling BED-type(Zn) family protein [Tanacetum coccineum]
MDSVYSDLNGADPTTTTTNGDASCGITRLKYHVAGIKGKGVAICKKASEEDKVVCATLVEKAKQKKKEKIIIEEEMRAEVEIAEEDNAFNAGSKRQKPNNLGLMDKFANAINPEGIPFHSIDNDGFKKFVETIGQYGRAYRLPSQYLLREPLLKEEVERTTGLLKKQEEEWVQNGCSVMTDGWTDRKRIRIMSFCVNYREGTTFLSSVECSKESHTGQFIFDYVEKGIEDVGPQNVIQVVTNNAANNMVAAQLLVNKRPSIFWTSCVVHTIDLMLEAIGKEGKFKDWIAKAKTLTIFIYAHNRTLALMTGVTRVATSFLTLQSLMEKQEKLRIMFTSDEWTQSKWAKTKNRKLAYSIIMSPSFWNGVNLCLKVISPLVKVLRLVDGDQKPSIGFLYGELKKQRRILKRLSTM